MRKILFILISLFLFSSTNWVNANWYWAHWEAKTIWDWATWCATDWDTTWWSPSFAPGPYSYDSHVIWESGINMRCEYWDSAAPDTLSVTYTAWWTNSAKVITVNAKDQGWSKLKQMILQQSKNWGAWTNVANWNGLTDPNNTLVTRTWTRSVSASWDNYKYQLITYDYAWNTTTFVNNTLIRFDTENPFTILWQFTSNPPVWNLLANNLPITIGYTPEFNRAPIIRIQWFFENKANCSNWFLPIENSNATSITFSNWYDEVKPWCDVVSGRRQYTLNITYLEDEAWNSVWTLGTNTPLRAFNYSVYANTTLMGISSVTTNELILNWNIANWSIKNLTLTLKDTFWNPIIPAPWISRTIDINWNVVNTMFLNQHERNWWNSVFLDKTAAPWSYLNRLPAGLISINSETSTDWTYNYRFKVYTPTSNQNFWQASDNLANFDINWMTFDANGTLWNIIAQWIWASTFSSKFSPLYYTSILWELVDNWISEWSIQNNSIFVTRNAWPSPLSFNLFVEYGSGTSNSQSNKLSLKFWKTSSPVTTLVWNWNPNASSYALPIEWNNNFFTKLQLLTGASINDIQNLYVSTHIWYTLDLHTIHYNSYVLWKSSYWGAIWTWNTYQSAVKIIWKTYTDKFNEILVWQEWNDVSILNWVVSKANLKSDVRKNVFSIIRNVPTNNGSRLVDSIWNFASNTDWKKLLQDTVLYFWWLAWANVTINWWTVTWNRTIIIEWWNAYITGNILTSWANGILWIVVLKDSNGNWWNIYIDPSVSQIKSILYADKSLISYNWIELWWNAAFSLLKNQLYIFGSVFSENTIGWSRASPLKCPYYITSCTSLDEAQKYDLNYLRRYYLQDTNSDWIWDTPAWWWTSVFWSGPNFKYPIVIKYNSQIQTNPPIIFKN